MCHQPSVHWMCQACQPASHQVLYQPSEHIHALVYLSAYDSALGSLVRKSKISGTRNTFVGLGLELARVVRREPVLQNIDGLVPVPSPWNRRLRRGFNPSAVMAHNCADTIQRPVFNPLRLKPGPRQATLSRTARAENFDTRLTSSGSVPRCIALIDDVYTTGATLDRCASHLIGLGAFSIIGLVTCITKPN